MGRIEALSEQALPSFIDGIANGLGYGMVLVVVTVVRNCWERGTLLNTPLFLKSGMWLQGFYENNSFYSAMALIVVGLMVWIYNAKNAKAYGTTSEHIC